MTSTEPTLTNIENTALLKRKADDALFGVVERNFANAREAAVKSAQMNIAALNLLRLCGIGIQEIAQRENVQLEWFQAHRDKLPKLMTFKAMKVCVHLARNHAEPIKTLEEAQAGSQLMFDAFNEREVPRRIEDQRKRPRNVWDDFVSSASSFAGMFVEMESEPIETWGYEKLKKFADVTEPIAERHARAKLLLAS